MPATKTQLSTLGKLQRASAASALLAKLSTEEKNRILRQMADALLRDQERVLSASSMAVASATEHGAPIDRLMLNAERITAMIASVRAIADLPDPVGEVISEWTRPNGLRIRKLRVPLGVIGVVYESRPNVTVDAAALAIKSGNAVVLRGGREATWTNEALVEILSEVKGLPEGAIELLDSNSRESVDELVRARGLVDVVIPRGGHELIEHVVEHATVPVIETGAGNCHVYVDESADFEKADAIVLNAKTQRPSTCNAAEKLLIHRRVAAEYVPRIVRKLRGAGVEVRGDAEVCRLAFQQVVAPASEEDWSTEYLDLRIAIGIVGNVEEAIGHINRYSTRHSECIVTEVEANARQFLNEVNSAAVYWNASTRFTDGGEFGFGAEVGISTQKLHCRGPFALAELTTTKYHIFGTGQVRA